MEVPACGIDKDGSKWYGYMERLWKRFFEREAESAGKVNQR